MNTENKELKFKTNIKCGGCIATVTPFFENVVGISSWEVDTANPDKILTIISKGITESEVIQKVQQAGFKIELLDS